MATEVDENAPAPRLCHVVRWADFDGYGFNLHTDKARNAQMIGKVDDNSPAEAAGLKKGDRIVEVNGINITNENHKQVVERIKAIADETRLLVVDPEADTWYQQNKVVIKGTQKNVAYLQNRPTRNGKIAKEETPSVSGSIHSDRPELPEVLHVTSEHEEEPRKVPAEVSTISERSVPEEEPKKPSRKSSVTSSKSGQSEVEIHPVPRTVPVHSEPAYPESLFSEVKPRSISEARREFFNQKPEEHEIDIVALGFGPDYTNFKVDEPKADMESMHEKVSVNKDNTEDELASKLVGYRMVEEETHEEHEHKHVHFTNSVTNGQNGHGDHHLNTSSPDGMEVIEEVVTHSPAFSHSPDQEKEQVFEKTEVHRHDGIRSPVENEGKGKDSGNEDTRSNSNSLSASSGDSSSVKDLSAREGTYDVTLSDDARTPSPSPAVVSRPTNVFPTTSNGHSNGTAEPETKPQARPNPQLYGNLMLHLTAQEMRAQLAQRTKQREDPRKKQIDLRKKYEMVSNM